MVVEATVDRAEKRSRNPLGDEKWMAGLLFSIRQNRQAVRAYVYLCTEVLPSKRTLRILLPRL